MARPEDAILEQLVGQGIGVSGLAQRAIQQSNLPDLQSAINQSQATFANRQVQREGDVNRQILANKQKLSSAFLSDNNGGSGGGVGVGSSAASPRYLLEIGQGYKDFLNAKPGTGGTLGTGSKFTIRGANVDHGFDNYEFSSQDELNAFLKNSPDVAATLATVAGDPFAKAGFTPNTPSVSVGEAQKLLRGGFMEGSPNLSFPISGAVDPAVKGRRDAQEYIAKRNALKAAGLSVNIKTPFHGGI